MKRAIFAKYHRNDTLSNAKRTIKYLSLSGATPTAYTVFHEQLCSHADIVRVFEAGSLFELRELSQLGLGSSIDENGVWRCINIFSPEESVLIYTAGSSFIMYYSVI